MTEGDLEREGRREKGREKQRIKRERARERREEKDRKKKRDRDKHDGVVGGTRNSVSPPGHYFQQNRVGTGLDPLYSNCLLFDMHQFRPICRALVTQSLALFLKWHFHNECLISNPFFKDFSYYLVSLFSSFLEKGC